MQWRTTGDGLRPQPNPHPTVLDLHIVGPRRPHGRHGEGRARADVKLRTVPGAGDLVVAEFAVGERPAVVCADVVDRIKDALDVKDRHHVAIDFNECLARVGNLGDVSDTDVVGHDQGFQACRTAWEGVGNTGRVPVARASGFLLVDGAAVR